MAAAVAPPYHEPTAEALAAALAHPGPEAHALVARAGGAVAGCVVFGAIAGADRAARLRLIAVDGHARRRGLALGLVRAATAEMFRAGARFVMVELPDDPLLAPCASLLARAGFTEVARVPDLVRDGLAMRYLQLVPPR